MTCVAYRDKVMAADGMVVYDGTVISTQDVKVFRLDDGSLFGAAGQAAAIEKLLEWVRSQDGPYPTFDDIAALRVAKDGKITFYDAAGGFPLYEKYAAVGAGADAALGAMFVGASARTAVRAASKHIQGVGGRIRTVKL